MEQVGAADHRLREIRVKIERHRDRNPRPDRLPHGRDEVALAVVQPLRHHRAVEIEEHARPGACPGGGPRASVPSRGRRCPASPARPARPTRRRTAPARGPPGSRPRSCRRGTCRCRGNARRSPRRTGGPGPRTAPDRSGCSRRCSSRATSSPGSLHRASFGLLASERRLHAIRPPAADRRDGAARARAVSGAGPEAWYVERGRARNTCRGRSTGASALRGQSFMWGSSQSRRRSP